MRIKLLELDLIYVENKFIVEGSKFVAHPLNVSLHKKKGRINVSCFVNMKLTSLASFLPNFKVEL